ncbi:Ger(x)C family spore germination protein [Paenibacillus wynnii]|uniref:Uncharacterized protein n=1 Tax=Paenibacillus wynnii TaxID=268407 RepID=A0A098M549_9BACL|nr:Ger(x)C family spore germination protein [Paenibacillus wynnii]KGE17163.1 hypothetical protein PWYN_21235 [Paenibacillus wynnii]
MKYIKLGVVALLILSLTGCWSKEELDDLTFVFGLYVDNGKKPGTVEVTISTPLPNRLMSAQQASSGGGDGKPYSIVSKTAPTITEAMISIQRDLTRRITLSHLKVVVIGEDYAKKGISELLEWLKREPGFPLGTYVLGCSGRAKEITKLTPVYEQQPSQVLLNFASDNFMFKTTIKDCLIAEASYSGFALTYLNIGTKPESVEIGKPEYWAGIQGAALYQKDKMKGSLNVREGIALAWAQGNIHFPLYSITWDEGKGTASALITFSKSSKAVSLSKKGPIFKISLQGTASMVSIKNSELHDIKAISATITEKLEQKISGEVSDAIRKTQKAGTDVLHLGLLMEWNYPQRWKKLQTNWEDYYTHDAEIKVSTHIHISNFGAAK